MDDLGHDPVRRDYDAVAGEYAAAFRNELRGKPLDRALLQSLLEQLPATDRPAAPTAQAPATAPGVDAPGPDRPDTPSAGAEHAEASGTGAGTGGSGVGVVADLGCGPGHVAGWLAGRGAAVVGIDLSGAMIEIARREQPRAEFRRGDLLDLPAADGEFAAAVAFYSIIHLDAGALRRAFAEAHRTLRPSGLLLLAFHVGSEVRHLDSWLGRDVALDFRFHEVSDVVEALEGTGFDVRMRMERAAHPGEVDTRRAYLLARRS